VRREARAAARRRDFENATRAREERRVAT
jgi:hypothetical protein